MNILSKIPKEVRAEAEATMTGDEVDREMFLAHNGYALPESDVLCVRILPMINKTCKKALVICDWFPQEALKILAEDLFILGEDLASAKAGQKLLNGVLIQNLEQVEKERFDAIFVLRPISSLPEPSQLLKTLYQLLAPNGTLWLMEENRVGFHRLGDHLMNEYRKELPKCWNQLDLEALFPQVDAYPVYNDSTEYDDLLELLIQKYPKHRRRMKNGLKLIETVFRITKEG